MYPELVLVRYGKTADMEMIVMKEEVCTRRSLEIDERHAPQGHLEKDQGRSKGRREARAEHDPEPFIIIITIIIIIIIIIIILWEVWTRQGRFTE